LACNRDELPDFVFGIPLGEMSELPGALFFRPAIKSVKLKAPLAKNRQTRIFF
jgi:hypothetical protein